jgi:hypothetical protein
MDNKKYEQINAKEHMEKLFSSELWLTMNKTETGVEVRFNDPNAINLIAMFLCSNDTLFKEISESVRLNKIIEKSDLDNDIAKSN